MFSPAHLVRLVGRGSGFVVLLLLAGLCLGFLVLLLLVLSSLLTRLRVHTLLLVVGLLGLVLGRIFGICVRFLLLGRVDVGLVAGLLLRGRCLLVVLLLLGVLSVLIVLAVLAVRAVA